MTEEEVSMVVTLAQFQTAAAHLHLEHTLQRCSLAADVAVQWWWRALVSPHEEGSMEVMWPLCPRVQGCKK